MGTRRLGVMGGTFDPVHNGHVSMATALLDLFELDNVLFVPAGVPWQKEGYSAAEDRWMMTALTAATDPRFEASRMEIDRKGPTYTVDTMAILRDFHGPDTELFFIAGIDAVITLGTWHRAEGLAGLAEVIAVPRPGFDAAALRPGADWPRVHVADVPEIDVSSTEVRKRVREGLPIDELVPPVVARYVAEHGLYRHAAEQPA